MQINEKLLQWYELNRRDLPWRNSSDPYHIWLSEIILQQTRVDQGMPYYYKFIETFPTIKHLANADEKTVLKLWQGLGYYSRAHNLHQTAKLISSRFNGIFPQTYDELISLKGIGPYTAAAIASIAFQQPEPVIDGNVYRFFSRLYAIPTPVPSTKAHKEFREVALNLFQPGVQPRLINQAIMEMGALVCTPKNPNCNKCPVAENCIAYSKGKTQLYPVKKTKTAVKEVHMHYAVIETPKGILFEKRNYSSIWKGLYQPLLCELISPQIESIHNWVALKLNVKTNQLSYTHSSAPFTHLLSHRKLIISFHHFQCSEKIPIPDNTEIHSHNKLHDLPFPIIVANYFLA